MNATDSNDVCDFEKGLRRQAAYVGSHSLAMYKVAGSTSENIPQNK